LHEHHPVFHKKKDEWIPFLSLIFGQDLQDELDANYRFPPETRNKSYPKNPVNPV
jgi:hypothetical protein